MDKTGAQALGAISGAVGDSWHHPAAGFVGADAALAIGLIGEWSAT